MSLGTDTTAFDLLEDYFEGVLVVLVSGKWVLEGMPNPEILKVCQYPNVIQVLNWNTDFFDKKNKIAESILRSWKS